MKIALAGNPNSGKTSLYNTLTGENEKVGNWAGVTVAQKSAKLKKSLQVNDENTEIIDLPGAYSMSPFTPEESVTKKYIQTQNPDVIINVVDSTSLNRSLFFTSQLLEIGIPIIVALNKTDINTNKGNAINAKKLSEILGCPVVQITSTSKSKDDFIKLIEDSINMKGKIQTAPFKQMEIDAKNKEDAHNEDIKRYDFVKTVIKYTQNNKVENNIETIQDKIDRVLTHKWLGILIFALIMWAVFSISQTYIGPIIADYLAAQIENFQGWVGSFMSENTSPFLSALLLDGIIGGVGAVIGFLPLIMVMFFLLALLEDCGYMARVAIIMDRFFKVVGLSGKSIIPMVLGTACGIPGIMSTRTIKNQRQRRTTAMLTPFMPCGAKLPVIALFAGVFFAQEAWVGTLMYFMGIFLIILGAYLIMLITGEKYARSFFVMELAEYHLPSVKRATISMLNVGKSFIIKAGTIILICNATIQIMQTFDWNFNVVAENMAHTSILATLSSPFALFLIPLGFGTWQLAAAAITGFIAKENVVGTLAVVFSITNFIDPNELALVGGAESVAEVMGLTSAAALAYLMFNLYTPPCFAAIGAMNSEMENKKWLFAGIALQFGTGYVVAFLVYQIGTLIVTGSLGAGFVAGLIIVFVLFVLLFTLIRRGNQSSEAKRLGLV